MKGKNAFRMIFFISIIGILFSGYLLVMELLKTCALETGCSYENRIIQFVLYLIMFFYSRKGLKSSN